MSTKRASKRWLKVVSKNGIYAILDNNEPVPYIWGMNGINRCWWQQWRGPLKTWNESAFERYYAGSPKAWAERQARSFSGWHQWAVHVDGPALWHLHVAEPS